MIGNQSQLMSPGATKAAKSAEDATITQLLQRWSAGDGEAATILAPRVYDELHRIAAAYFQRERSNHTLQPTAVVHEAYLKLLGTNEVCWQNREQFFGIAAKIMRRILVDYARRHNREKRGSGQQPETLIEEGLLPLDKSVDLLALEEALKILAKKDSRKASIIELRFFGGLSSEEIARLLGVSLYQVNLQWRLARSWLYQEIKG